MTDLTIIKLNPRKISIRKSLGRVRKDLGDIVELANSIKTYGQKQPILINKNYELIDGGRRLAACLYSNIDILATIVDAVDSPTMIELEAEINIRRDDFTPAEKLLALSRLHRSKQGRYGATKPGKSTGWSVSDTAKHLKRKRVSVQDDLKLAEAIEKHPELEQKTSKNAIRKAVQAIKQAKEVVKMEPVEVIEEPKPKEINCPRCGYDVRKLLEEEKE